MYKFFVNDKYLFNSYHIVLVQGVIDQMRKDGWSVMYEASNPYEIYIYSNANKTAQEYILPLGLAK